MILPAIMEEILSCRDVIAQEYLMDVIVQVFHDDLHLGTLDTFLAATAKLQRNVNVKGIVISVMERFKAYAIREKDRRKENEESGLGGLPEDGKLFEVFWGQIQELVNVSFALMYFFSLSLFLLDFIITSITFLFIIFIILFCFHKSRLDQNLLFKISQLYCSLY